MISPSTAIQWWPGYHVPAPASAAAAYTALLRDDYPPFGDGPYPAELVLDVPEVPRDRVSVAFRIILAIPHLLAVWVLAWRGPWRR